MESIEYRRMFELEESHWWFRSRLLMTEGLLQRNILPHYAPGRPRLLDLGCGTGYFLQRRLRDTDACGIDFSAEALRFCRERDVHAIARADATRLPFPDACFDVVTAFDLIEHVADDRGLVAEMHRVLRPGGFLLATVPAHPFLWSGHDVSLHHHRRYTRRAFDALFDAAGWETLRMTGAFGLIFPAAAVIRLTRRITARHRPPQADTTPAPAWLNRMMLGVHRAEAGWLRRRDLPTGISLMTLRRKR